MTESAFRSAKADLSLLRWIWGWHPVVSPVMIVFLVGGLGYYFGAGSRLSLVALVLAVPIWYQGMRYINRNWTEVRDGYVRDVETVGPTVLEAAGMDSSGSVHTLVATPDERLPFVEAPSTVEASVLGLDEAAVWVYDQTELDLMFLKGTVGTEPTLVTRIDHELIESVTYDGELVIEVPETADVPTVRLPSSDPPTALLDALQGP